MKKPIKPLEELLDSVRDIEGFPIGKDEDILAFSDPPYYTSCPNPYINDFIEEYGTTYIEETDDYHREPFVGDVSEGKTDPVYMSHTYHTKVPHKAIMHYVNHFTEQGNLILDGFCGSGMTGVAASFLGRNSILSDLSPIAAFIANSLNKNINSKVYINEFYQILKQVENECLWVYETKHINDSKKEEYGVINYIVWSDILICNYCQKEYNFWNEAIDSNRFFKSEYNCPHCKAIINKSSSSRVMYTVFDELLNKKTRSTLQQPVLINYIFKSKRYEKIPDEKDLRLIDTIKEFNIPYYYPTDMLPIGEKTIEPIRTHYCTNVHHFYTKRNLYVLSTFFHYAQKSVYKNQMIFTLTSFMIKTGSRLHNIGLKNGKINLAGAMPNTIYIPSIVAERNLLYLAERKAKDIGKAFQSINVKSKKDTKSIIQVCSSLNLNIKSNTIDYIFVDPPFGANLMYSELNFIWESWLKVFTNNKSEAIINKYQDKKLYDYGLLMLKSFKEFYRVLKPNRWITVEFHNSKSFVWNAIQDAMAKAGFVIAQVAILDKKQGTYNQMVSAGSVEKDLVISAYKPKQSFEYKFLEMAGEGLEEEFIKMHLSHLKAEPTIERTEQMLYSKLLAYYVQRSYAIKYDASTFYKMLHDNFVEEDGYWFNKDQLENYREFKQKMKLEEINDLKSGQMLLFIDCEKTAIIWLHTFLDSPKGFQVIHPAFTKIENISGDSVPELMELLDKNFILENEKYRRPQTENEKMSITQKRERELQREFDVLLLEAKGSKKKIKECRKQAVIYGFEQCYKNNRFQDILALGKRLNKKIIENDSELSEFIEVAELKVEGF